MNLKLWNIATEYYQALYSDPLQDQDLSIVDKSFSAIPPITEHDGVTTEALRDAEPSLILYISIFFQ